jgi:hypothetical protein
MKGIMASKIKNNPNRLAIDSIKGSFLFEVFLEGGGQK